ncbi:TMV resistance protein N [Trifolium repens]|nr:TMV resistance protein N [Trifolium repens]
MAMLQSPSSSNSNGFTYDVFLSFRGPDTRYSFTGNLYKALCDRGIRTFIDDKELQRGYEITPSLVKAIEDSRILIPILSINYASSSFCLDELVCIIHCLASKGRLVLPVFYGVEPSNIRHQTGVYGKDIAKHKKRFQSNKEKYTDNMERLLKWKVALTQTTNLSGYHFNFRNEYEYEVIGKIVDDVSNKINRDRLHVGMMNDDDVQNDYDYDDYDYI